MRTKTKNWLIWLVVFLFARSVMEGMRGNRLIFLVADINPTSGVRSHVCLW